MKSGQMYQTVDPVAYLRLARELALRPEPEALRTAADRAYYATFLTCREVLASKGYLVPEFSTKDHEYVTTALRRKEVLGTLGNDEFLLRRARNCVTYNPSELHRTTYVDARSLDWIMATAQKIIDGITALPHNPDHRK